MSEEDRFTKFGSWKKGNFKSGPAKNDNTDIKSSRNGFRGPNGGNRNGNGRERGFGRSERFQRNPPHPAAHKKKGKGKKSQDKVDGLKSREEYSHLLNSSKLTVFDWDSTVVLRNIPAQVEAVKKAVQKELKDISINKFCPVKRTFKSRAIATLACVLNKRSDVDCAISKLSSLKIGDFSIIVSRFVKPHSFVSNAFSACLLNFPDDATEQDISEILKDCGVINSLDVEYSESGAVKKVLVNLTNSSDLALLLDKNRMQLKSAYVKVIPIKASSSVIVGNVHPKTSNGQISKLFGENALLVQKVSNIYQIFFENEESAENALSKNGECIRDLHISVRPWSKENLKQFKVFISITGNPNGDESKFKINEFLAKCAKLCSVSPVKKNRLFIAAFESKEGQKAALQLTGSIFNGWTVEVTKKRPSAKKTETEAVDGNSVSKLNTGISIGSSSKKNHVYFE